MSSGFQNQWKAPTMLRFVGATLPCTACIMQFLPVYPVRFIHCVGKPSRSVQFEKVPVDPCREAHADASIQHQLTL